jgi:hypothetical protein
LKLSSSPPSFLRNIDFRRATQVVREMSFEEWKSRKPSSIFRAPEHDAKLNQMQESVAMCLENVRLDSVPEFKIWAVQGPPGTGKTRTMVHSIIRYIERNPESGPVLVCTPSNVACDEIACEIDKHFRRTRMYKEKEDPVVRFGNTSPRVNSIHVKTIVQRRFEASLGFSLPHSQSSGTMDESSDMMNDSSDVAKTQTILKQSKVVCTTLNASAVVPRCGFRICFIDEASQVDWRMCFTHSKLLSFETYSCSFEM